MSTLTSWVLAYSVYIIVSSAVNALLPPENPRTFYGWLYRFLQLVTANASIQVESRFHFPSFQRTEQPVDQTTMVAVQKTTLTP